MTFIPFDGLARPKKSNSTGYWAIVVDNDDPIRLQRIRVVAEGSFEAINRFNLPWVLKMNPCFLGGSTSSESVNVPELNSKVWICFPFANNEMPAYGPYPYTNTTHTGEFDEDYPNVYGFVDSIGTKAKVNKATGNRSFETKNFSAVVDASGKLKIDATETEISGGINFIIGASGSFLSLDGKQILVENGIITMIS